MFSAKNTIAMSNKLARFGGPFRKLQTKYAYGREYARWLAGTGSDATLVEFFEESGELEIDACPCTAEDAE